MDNGSTITAGRPIHCKAAVLWTPGDKYTIETVVVAPPKKNQVRVKILYVSICHTDVTVGRMKALAPLFPIIPGHEAVGVVESVSEGVTNVQAGDHVLPFMQGQCGACSYCNLGRTNVCKELPLKTISPTLVPSDEAPFTTEDGRAINIFGNVSAFRIGAAWNVAKVTPGSTVAVFGLGTVGLAITQACKLAGASRIIGVDMNPNKFEKGKDLGLTDFINPNDHNKSVSTVLIELTGGGVDFAFECVGIMKLMSEDVLCTVTDVGMTLILGVPAVPTDEFQINAFDFIRGKTVCGTILGGIRVRDLPDLVKRCMSKEFRLDPYITHNLPFSQINEAMEIFDGGDCLRCVLKMGV